MISSKLGAFTLIAALATRGRRIGMFLGPLLRWQSLLIAVVTLAGNLFVSQLDAMAAGPWKGQIVDKETGKPLEGVVVLVSWYKAYSTPGGWGGAEYYDSEEVVTDASGRFIIQSRQTWTLNPFSAIKGPEFNIFKAGYGRWQFQGQDRWSKDALEREEQRKQVWKTFEGDGVVLELPHLKNRQQREEFLSLALPAGYVPEEQIPRYLTEINKERVSLGFQPIGRGKDGRTL
jgi:hypothetical protein